MSEKPPLTSTPSSGGGKERAFAQRILRHGSTDFRKSNSGSDQGPFKRGSLYGATPLFDIADPVDFEECILQHQPLADEVDGAGNLYEFPDDDIEVTAITRKYRTVEPPLPKNIATVTEPHVIDCVKSYTSNWSVVNRKYLFRGFGGKDPSRQRATRTDSFVQKLYKHEYEVDEKSRQNAHPDLRRESSDTKGGNEMPRGSWASSICDLQSCEPDTLFITLLDPIPLEDVDRHNDEVRKRERIHSLFSVYMPQEEDELFVRRTPAVIPQEHFGQKIMFKCLELRLELDVEPIFASMALYDGKARRKISENFHFDMNRDWHKKMLSQFTPRQDMSSLARGCIFSLTYPSTDVFLVVKLEKILQQGDITECAEPYMKDAENQKNKEKARANAEQFCEKLGKFRMPFAWTAIHLGDVLSGAVGSDVSNQQQKEQAPAKDSALKKPSPDMNSARQSSKKNDLVTRKPSNSAEIGKPSSSRFDRARGADYDEPTADLTNFRPLTLNVSTFFKQESDKLTDDDMFKFLADLRRPSSLARRLKCIPGSLKLDISSPSDNTMYCLTPELQQVVPYPDLQGRPIKEIQEFAPREVFVPYVTYKNTLYVYPTHLNFSSRSGSARNIAVKIQFMASEDPNQAIECIYGKSGGPEFTKEAWTAVTYHNKSPDFYEEVKIKLPADITEKHHLLFTFYHISFKSEKTGPIEPTVVGYTWLPAAKDGRLQFGEFCLPVAIDKLPQSYSYLLPDSNLPLVRWVDGQKGVFNVSIHTQSSIHTQDIFMHRFFHHCHQIEGRLPPTVTMRSPDVGNWETNLRKSVLDLNKAQEEPLVRFLHLVIDKLLMLLVRPPTVSGTVVNIGQAAFESLAHIVHRIHMLLDINQDKHGRNNLLTSYIAYVFTTSRLGSPMTSPVVSPVLQRPASMNVGHGSGVAKSLSNSNPDIHESAMSHSHSLSMGGNENWMKEPFSDYTNIAGNRGSVAEARPSSGKMQQLTTHGGSRKLVHEELALQWAVASHPCKEMAMAHAWFFFELMIKSMAQYLDLADKFFWPRKERFHDRFLDDVTALINTVTSEIINKQERNFRNARLLNASLGFFLNDSLSLMDRGFVMNLLKNYMKEMTTKGAFDPNLSFLKLELLHILCTHEHYVVLNLPFPLADLSTPPSPSPSMTSLSSDTSSRFSLATDRELMANAELSVEFREQHFMVGLLLSELRNAFDMNEQDLMKQAVDVLKDLINSHDVDTRFDSPNCRSRIAALYMPLLTITMDILPQLFGFEREKDGVTEGIAMAIAMSSVLPTRYSQAFGREDSRLDYQNQLGKTTILNVDSTRSLLMCVLWVLKNTDHKGLRLWWGKTSTTRIHQLLEVLDLCIKLFEYQGKKPQSQPQPGKRIKGATDSKARLQTLEEAIMSKGAARDMLSRHKGSSAAALVHSGREDSPKLRWRKDQIQWKKSNDPLQGGEQEINIQIEGSLAAEVSLITLDTLELIVQTVMSNDPLRTAIGQVLRVLLHCLGTTQSTLVLQNMFATQRSIVKKFPELLFEDDTEICADLCFRLLNHSSSSLNKVRAHASASLYLLMRQNFEIGNNFARVKMQVTMSLSSLVGSSQIFNEDHLRRALKTIMIYAQEDEQLKSAPFPEQVRELVFNLHMILSDTVKMKEYHEDPEMLIDLMYRIAKGYQNSPDLRLTWLQNMAGKHSNSGYHTEAGLCLVHQAALVSEYLSMLEDKRYLPIGCVSFEKISHNVLEESAVSDDVISPDEEGICTGKYFSESGLVGLLEQAALSFSTGQIYELVNEVYKILIPIHEARRDHRKLSQIHNKLGEAFSRIGQLYGKRMMGTYFRVAFYGGKFGDIDGEEYVYKEPGITKLPEISHRLQSFYGDKFGHDNVEVIKDSNVVDPNKLDPNKAYIQITYVEPYFEDFELSDRITYYDKNTNLWRFVFVTPFTPSGKAHGDLANQYKRKTILTVANFFPYIKTRINVVARDEIVLTPIEVAIEDIQLKTKELVLALEMDPPDAKMLQMVLQGCVGTTVNQGPMEIANVFLADFENEGQSHVTRNHHKLRLCFKEFVKKCGEALSKNKTLIQHDQRAYQKELERNYKSFVEKLEPLLKRRFGTLRGSLRKKDGTPLFRQPSGHRDDYVPTQS